MFFRDPQRRIVQDDAILLAPADGRIADIETVPEGDFIGGPALRIGIFLSIFNTHINRAPCDAKVEKITYRSGKYLNAMNRLAGKVNESNNLALVRTSRPQDRLLVRQISGAIARRIVCAAREGQQLGRRRAVRHDQIRVPDRAVPARQRADRVPGPGGRQSQGGLDPAGKVQAVVESSEVHIRPIGP